MDSFLPYLAVSLWAAFWQSCALIALIGTISLLARRTSPEFRYWLWCIVLLRLCVPTGLETPVGLPWGDLISGKQAYRTAIQSPIEHAVGIQSGQTPPSAPNTAPGPSTLPSQKRQSHPFSLTYLIVLAWLCGVCSIGALVFMRTWSLHWKLQNCTPIERSDLHTLLDELRTRVGIARPIGLYSLADDIADSPAAAGVLRPRIYLPRSIADSWSPEELAPVLLHELAHIKRCDSLVNWLQVIVQTIWFFHPLVWLANHEIRRLREEACDDLAVNWLENERERYTQSIIRIIRGNRKAPVFGFIGSGFAERRTGLSERIERIMNDNYGQYRRLTRASVLVLIAVGIAGISLAATKTSSGNLSELLAAIEKADATVQNGMGAMKMEQIPPQEDGAFPHQQIDVFFAFSGPMLRCDEKFQMPSPSGGRYPALRQYAWNGRKMDLFSREDVFPDRPMMSGSIKLKNAGAPFVNYDPRSDCMNLRGKPVAEFLRTELKDLRLTGDEVLDSIPCKVLQGYKGTSDSSRVVYTVWIAPDRMYRIKQMQVSVQSGGKVLSNEMIDNKFHKTGAGIWFPENQKRESYRFDSNSGKMKPWGTTIRKFAPDFVVNGAVPDSLFELPFPKGLTVADERTQKK